MVAAKAICTMAIAAAGGAVASELWAAIGVGLGALVRHQVAVIAA